ncbi:MAG: serine/threonine-protein kinase [Planctomycetota bacterium]
MPAGQSPPSHGPERGTGSGSGSLSAPDRPDRPESPPPAADADADGEQHEHTDNGDHHDRSPDGIVAEVELPQLPGLTERDVDLARAAVKKRLVNPDVARRALTALSGLRRRGEMVSIAQIFVSHRHLDAAAVRKLLIDLDYATLVCPKAECGARFNLRDFPPSPVYTCRRCGAPLGYLGLDGDEGVEADGKPTTPAKRTANASGNLLPLPDVIKEQSSLLESDFDESTLLDTNRLRTLRDVTAQIEPDADLRPDEAIDLPANQASMSDPAAVAPRTSKRADGPVADALIDLATDDIIAGRGSLVYALRITRGVKAEFDLPSDGAVRAVLSGDSDIALHRTPAHIRFGYEGELKPEPESPTAPNEQRLLVRDRDMRRMVRMRLLQNSDVATNDEIEGLLQEAQIAGQIEHPGVPPVYDVGLDSANRVYVIERLVDRQSTLSKLLAARHRATGNAAAGPGSNSRGRNSSKPKPAAGTQSMMASPSTRYLFEVLLRVADVLACAHARGVEYRNLRPANIVIGGFGTVYLVDWSHAHLRGRPEANAERLIISGRMPGGRVVTLDGGLVPGPEYISPEQAAGELEQLGPQSDVHALGAIAYEIVCGFPPYTGADGWAVLSSLRTGRPLPLEKISAARNVPKAVRRVIMRALARNPAERHADAVEFRRELRAALDASGLMGPREFPGTLWNRLRTAVARLFVPSRADDDPFGG